MKECKMCNEPKEAILFPKQGGLICKECLSIKNKQYYNDHRIDWIEYNDKRKDKKKENDRQYRIKNKDKLNRYFNKYFTDRSKNDPNFKILRNLRGRIYDSLKRNHKSAHTIELLGCSIEELKEHLQQTAIQNGYLNFNINDYSGQQYHIDHIIPCDSFNLQCSYHQKICFHYSNLQILSAKDNLLKSNKYDLTF